MPLNQSGITAMKCQYPTMYEVLRFWTTKYQYYHKGGSFNMTLYEAILKERLQNFNLNIEHDDRRTNKENPSDTPSGR